ncbi:MAG: putative ABC transporter permease [Spirochaetales bacterium]|nr:putative ABC transporter permease [Spirochaetales bacterium]
MVLFSRFLLFFLKYFLLFFTGTVVGWFIELFWRRYFGKARRWINPGFLNGPWLPLYGFGCIFLYLLCLPEWPVYIQAPVFLVSLTVLEFVAGMIFIGHFKIKLWDYSQNWGNLKGLVCPLYSVFWMILGMVFSLFIYPYLEVMVLFLFEHREMAFFIGLYGGLFSVDLWQSFNLAMRIKAFVQDTEERWSLDFEKFKLELRDRVQEGLVNRTRFFLPFQGELGGSLRERLNAHRKNLPKPLAPLRKALDKRREKK